MKCNIIHGIGGIGELRDVSHRLGTIVASASGVRVPKVKRTPKILHPLHHTPEISFRSMMMMMIIMLFCECDWQSHMRVTNHSCDLEFCQRRCSE